MMFPLEAGPALEAVRSLIGIAVGVNALELVWLQRHFAGDGLLALEKPARRDALLLALAQLGAALLLALQAGGAARTAALAIVLAVPLLLRRCLPFGADGSEQMVRVVAGALLIESLAPGDALERACLWFIAVQSVCAYATAGLAKLAMPAWRDGKYLRQVLSSRTWSRTFAAAIVKEPAVARWLSRGVIAYESAAPLALLAGPAPALLFCLAGAAFHLANAAIMGLNLFVWSFAATYPAILFCAQDMARMLAASSAN